MTIFIVTVLNSGCETIDPAVDIPSYITIQSVDMVTDYATEGTDDHNITDVWILVGDDDLGAYELPATIPVLNNGVQQVRIYGGIKVNGISSNRSVYPFFNTTTLPVTLVPGSTVDVYPTLSYYSGITFAWLEDFEIGSTLEKASISDTSLSLESVTSLPAMGTQSAVIRVDATNDFFMATTSGKQFKLPQGRPIYLEVNYYSTVQFSVGAVKNTVLGGEFLDPYFNVYPSTGWNKVYIKLTDYVSPHLDALSWEIYFSCLYDATVANNVVYLDNIKLIYQ